MNSDETAFFAFFTHPMYRDDSWEFGPFSTDEGADFFDTWARRRQDVEQFMSVRQLLSAELATDDVDGFIDEVVKTSPELDGVIVAAAFTLLRLSNRIDSEGLTWVLEALGRWSEHYECPEAETMNADLHRFNQKNLDDVLGESGPVKSSRERRDPWLHVDVYPPEPIGESGRWSEMVDPSRDSLVWALEQASEKLRQRVAPYIGNGTSESEWSKWCDANIGPDSAVLVRLQLRPNGKSRVSVRGVPGQDHTVTTVIDPNGFALSVSASEASDIVVTAVNSALVRLAEKLRAEAPPPLPLV